MGYASWWGYSLVFVNEMGKSYLLSNHKTSSDVHNKFHLFQDGVNS